MLQVKRKFHHSKSTSLFSITWNQHGRSVPKQKNKRYTTPRKKKRKNNPKGSDSYILSPNRSRDKRKMALTLVKGLVLFF